MCIYVLRTDIDVHTHTHISMHMSARQPESGGSRFHAVDAGFKPAGSGFGLLLHGILGFVVWNLGIRKHRQGPSMEGGSTRQHWNNLRFNMKRDTEKKTFRVPACSVVYVSL